MPGCVTVTPVVGWVALAKTTPKAFAATPDHAPVAVLLVAAKLTAGFQKKQPFITFCNYSKFNISAHVIANKYCSQQHKNRLLSAAAKWETLLFKVYKSR